MNISRTIQKMVRVINKLLIYCRRLLHFFNLEIVHSSHKNEVLDLIRLLQPKPSYFNALRVGPNGDGGYVVPEDLIDIQYAFSPGCNNAWEFEYHLGEEWGIKSFMLDVQEKKPLNLTPLQSYRNGWLDSVNLENHLTLDEWICREGISHTSELLLQMDIEGFEYKCLMALDLKTLQRFKILIIEFHNLNWLMNKPFFDNLVEPVFTRILNDFYVFNVHANNGGKEWQIKNFKFPDTLEITFHRKDRLNIKNVKNSNVDLNFPNIEGKKDISVQWDDFFK